MAKKNSITALAIHLQEMMVELSLPLRTMIDFDLRREVAGRLIGEKSRPVVVGVPLTSGGKPAFLVAREEPEDALYLYKPELVMAATEAQGLHLVPLVAIDVSCRNQKNRFTKAEVLDGLARARLADFCVAEFWGRRGLAEPHGVARVHQVQIAAHRPRRRKAKDRRRRLSMPDAIPT
jgi:hypothetical protein